MIAMKLPLIIAAFLLISFSANAQEAPKSTDEILKEAYQQAAKESKNVFILFHASWCGWCHKMDTAMNDKLVKDYFDKNFVIKHLVVHESADKKNLENAGSLEFLTKYKGQDEGIPYWLIFDKNGKLLADSKMRPEGASLEAEGKNSGCPASKEEVEHFIKVLRKTTPLKEDQLNIIAKRFRQNEQQ
jgi:thiol-disulfide isomerase/thioredoxin